MSHGSSLGVSRLPVQRANVRFNYLQVLSVTCAPAITQDLFDFAAAEGETIRGWRGFGSTPEGGSGLGLELSEMILDRAYLFLHEESEIYNLYSPAVLATVGHHDS